MPGASRSGRAPRAGPVRPADAGAAATAVAAVGAGALTLAVGGVLGGDTFDVLKLAVGDVAYRSGSLYHAAGRGDLLLTTTTLLITAVLVAGLVRRQRAGPGRVGLESVLVPLLWVGAIVMLAV